MDTFGQIWEPGQNWNSGQNRKPGQSGLIWTKLDIMDTIEQNWKLGQNWTKLIIWDEGTKLDNMRKLNKWQTRKNREMTEQQNRYIESRLKVTPKTTYLNIVNIVDTFGNRNKTL